MKNQSKLNQKITFSSKTTTNDHGAKVVTWTGQGSEWAEVVTAHGSEAISAAKQDAKETIRVRIRYRADIKTTWRMQWNAQYYYLESVDRSANRDGELWFTAVATEVL